MDRLGQTGDAARPKTFHQDGGGAMKETTCMALAMVEAAIGGQQFTYQAR
jgi:hypothetical protein